MGGGGAVLADRREEEGAIGEEVLKPFFYWLKPVIRK